MRRPILLASLALAGATSAAAIEPGEWRSTTQMADIALPAGMPEQVGQMMRRQMGQAISSTQCITREDIEQTPEKMFQESNGECRYTRFDMSGGKLDGAAVCETGQGSMNMTMTGTHTDDTYDMRMVVEGDMGMGQMSMTYRTTGERVGACG